ncbi:ribosome assembly cofactor RimP [Flavobacteriaceae bacterium]|nr:ribosome assembly cofactor RimP [Flavobacteriaceae bacterium]
MNKFFDNIINEYFDNNTNLFLVDASVDSSNKINIIIDGDKGVKISDCVSLGKYLKNNLEDEIDDFSFEVSSAGMTSPLITHRQFLKNLNRKLNILSVDGEEYIGNLSEVKDDNVTIEWFSRESKPIGKGKISVKKNKSLLFNEIKQAKLIVEF